MNIIFSLFFINEMKQTVTGYYKIIKRTEISDKEYEKKKTGLPIQAIEKD